MRGHELHPGAHVGESTGELLVSCPEMRSPGKVWAVARHVSQPIAYGASGGLGTVAMRFDVLAGNVRNEFLKPIAVPIQDQASLGAVPSRTESLHPEKNSKLQRHVKTGQLALSVEFSARHIVDSQCGGADQPIDFLDAHLARVVMLQTTSWHKSANCNGENDRPKMGSYSASNGQLMNTLSR